MTGPKIGKVEYVDIRNVWEDEAKDFTPWVASEEGLRLLGDAIDASLEIVQQEAKVGPFRADVLAQIAGEDEHFVVVENQFGTTDHDHLGKLITYASGLNAKAVVWIAETFTEEHRQALDWINETAGERVGFFGLEVYVIKIGDSDPAPQLKVISKPNLWAQAVRESRDESEFTATKLDQKRFWEEMIEFIKTKGSHLPVRKAFPQHWYEISIGKSGFVISLTTNSKLNRVGCELYLSGTRAKQSFALLKADEEIIEKEIGQELDWQLLEGKEACRIALYTEASISNEIERQKAKEWLFSMAERFHKVFGPRVKALKLPQEVG
jgi:hypothetical protein